MSSANKEKEILAQLIPALKTETITELTSVIEVLTGLSRDYVDVDDIHSMEGIKKEFNANLQYMATLYAKIKFLKGPNHTYMEAAIKRLKAETMDIIMREGAKVTTAEKNVYMHPYYIERFSACERMIRFCVLVEESYNQFNATLSSLVQSISVLSKEMVNSRTA